jgi:hypothetical protein
MTYELDQTYKMASEAVGKLRRRVISWSEQEPFFMRHLPEYSGDLQMVMDRARLGSEKYGDQMFWYPKETLIKMREEELVDAFVYDVVLRCRDEIIGEDSASDNRVYYRGAETVCDECPIQLYVKAQEKLICMSLSGCIYTNKEGLVTK